jgi:NADP-dependent 3-hydroxy acid dehydrogenase YdfG
MNSSSKYPEFQAGFGNYVKNKQELDENVKAKTLRMRAGVSTFNCRVTNLIIGWTDTDMIKFLRHIKKMPPSKVAETVKWVLDQPQDIQIFELAVWHQNTSP